MTGSTRSEQGPATAHRPLPRRVVLTGNVVAVASRRPLPVDDIADRLEEFGLLWQVADEAQLDAFVGDARVLTDDYAPVDQLLTPYG